jgi:hypothetical protein
MQQAPAQPMGTPPPLMQQSGQPTVNVAPSIPGSPNYGIPTAPSIPN